MGRVANTRFGIEQGSVWGTEVAVGSADEVLVESLDVTREGGEFLPDPSLGAVWGRAGHIGSKAFEGTLNARIRYGANIWRLIALAFGTSGSPSGGGPYTHTIALADRLAKFLSLAWPVRGTASTTVYKSVPSAKIEEVNLRFDGAGPHSAAFRLVGTQIARDAGTNGSTQIGNLTVPDSKTPVLLPQGRFRLNAAGGATLASGDALTPTVFEVTLRRPLSRDFKADASGALAEPVESDVAEVLVTLEFSAIGAVGSYKTDIDEFRDFYEAGTELKAEMLFTGPSPNTVQFEFPRLQVTENADGAVPGTGRYPHRVTLRALVAASAPTGMAVTQPCQITVVDGLSGAYVS